MGVLRGPRLTVTALCEKKGRCDFRVIPRYRDHRRSWRGHPRNGLNPPVSHKGVPRTGRSLRVELKASTLNAEGYADFFSSSGSFWAAGTHADVIVFAVLEGRRWRFSVISLQAGKCSPSLDSEIGYLLSRPSVQRRPGDLPFSFCKGRDLQELLCNYWCLMCSSIDGSGFFKGEPPQRKSARLAG